MNDRKYFICHKTNYPWIDDFAEDHNLKRTGIIESMPCTLRRATDGDSFIVKTTSDADVPYWIHANDASPYTHAQITVELQGAIWQSEEDE